MSLGDRIKQVRNGASQMKFGANLGGVTPNTIRRYEDGKNPPDATFLENLCRVYNINPTWLLLGEGPMRSGEAAGAGLAAPPKTAPQSQDITDAVNITELLNMTAEVLVSNTVYRPALAANIKAFHRSIALEHDNQELKSRVDSLETRLEALEQKKSLAA